MEYEYQCRSCGETAKMTVRGATEHLVRDEDGEYMCGPLKRVWGFALSWDRDLRGH